ncbi:MAG: hypothetical protein R6U64_04840 [Bacteroidales bacterium]
MGNYTLRYVGIAVIVILLQVLVFNNILFAGFVNPYIYVFLILLLPVDIKGGLLLVMAFLLGMIIDLFSGSGGMHTAAALFMAFMRPGVIRMISVKAEFEQGTIPSILNMGASWIMTYSLILILLHHSLLFFLEIFRFTEPLQTLQRILLSGAFTFAFVLMGFYLTDRTIRKRRA